MRFHTATLDRFQHWLRINQQFWFYDFIDHFSGTVYIAGGSVKDWVVYTSPLIGKPTRYNSYPVDPPWLQAVCYIQEQKLADIDCFFPDANTCEAFGQFLLAHNFVLQHESENAFTYHYIYNDTVIAFQAIHRRYYPTLISVLNDVDLTPCLIGLERNKVTWALPTLHDIRDLKMQIHHPNPATILARVLKYARKGYMGCDEILLQAVQAMQTEPEIMDRQFTASSRYTFEPDPQDSLDLF